MKEVIITIIVIAIILSGVSFGLIKLIGWSNSENEEFRQEKKMKFGDCLSKTDYNIDWCYNNFID